MLRSLLREDAAGRPMLVSAKYKTSHNTVHHLYHLAKYEAEVGEALRAARTVIEWGGGYGNQAKVFLRLAAQPVTYVIVDLPLLSCLQHVYLSTVLGSDRVNLLDSPDGNVQPRKVNLLPVTLLERHSLYGDLFISTWALSESSGEAQDFVVSHAWFACPRLLLAYQDAVDDYPFAERVGEIANAEGARTMPISFLPGNHYAFR
jgi:putative sugar O-methyltransferase